MTPEPVESCVYIDTTEGSTAATTRWYCACRLLPDAWAELPAWCPAADGLLLHAASVAALASPIAQHARRAWRNARDEPIEIPLLKMPPAGYSSTRTRNRIRPQAARENDRRRWPGSRRGRSGDDASGPCG